MPAVQFPFIYWYCALNCCSRMFIVALPIIVIIPLDGVNVSLRLRSTLCFPPLHLSPTSSYNPQHLFGRVMLFCGPGFEPADRPKQRVLASPKYGDLPTAPSLWLGSGVTFPPSVWMDLKVISSDQSHSVSLQSGSQTLHRCVNENDKRREEHHGNTRGLESCGINFDMEIINWPFPPPSNRVHMNHIENHIELHKYTSDTALRGINQPSSVSFKQLFLSSRTSHRLLTQVDLRKWRRCQRNHISCGLMCSTVGGVYSYLPIDLWLIECLWDRRTPSWSTRWGSPSALDSHSHIKNWHLTDYFHKYMLLKHHCLYMEKMVVVKETFTRRKAET